MKIGTERIRKIQQGLEDKDSKGALTIPENWVDFARLTSIRSGGTLKRFDPWDFQIKLVDLMLERSVCIVKSRQMGVSELITCFMLWRAAKDAGYLGLVFSKTQADSSLLARRMKRMIESVGLKTATENLSDIEVKGAGRILFRNSKPESGRGIESVTDVFYDEMAFLDTAKEVRDAVSPSQQMVGANAREFIVSTPNGRQGYYWDILSSGNGDRNIDQICEKVGKGEDEPFQYWIDDGGWGKALLNWRAHPLYGNNPNFLNDIHEKQKLSWETINQEFNLCFTQTSISVFDSELVQNAATGELADYEEGFQYFIGIDSATTGNDYCAAVVLRYDVATKHYSLVHCYQKRNETSAIHIYKISLIIDKYKPYSVGIEVNGAGAIFFEQLSRQHNHIHFESVITSQNTKEIMIANLRLALEQGVFSFPQKNPILEELLNFVRSGDGKKLGAAGSKKDDVLMATAVSLYGSPLNSREKPELFDTTKIVIHDYD